jgi:hypothetical protein
MTPNTRNYWTDRHARHLRRLDSEQWGNRRRYSHLIGDAAIEHAMHDGANWHAIFNARAALIVKLHKAPWGKHRFRRLIDGCNKELRREV